MGKIKSFTSEKVFERVFQLWFLCFPFGAGFLTLSLVFFTIYPSMFVSGILFILTLFFKPYKLDKFYMMILAFWAVWLIYALARLVILPVINFHDAIFDLRSLFMFALTIYLVFLSVKILGWEKFRKNIADLSLVLFVIFTVIGFFEFFSGIHIAGMRTLKILNEPVSNVTYAPFFVYDNPNNFIVYYFLFSLLIMLFHESIRRNIWALITIVLLVFFFSYVADARFGKYSSYLMIIVVLFAFRPKIKIVFYALALAFAILCFLWKPLFYGPVWQNGEKYQLNELTCLQTDSTLKICSIKDLKNSYSEDTLMAKIAAYKNSKGESGNIRLGLIKNGLYLFKQSRFLGVGPGQFISYHRIKKVPVDVGTQLSAHAWLIEILSQYGVIIFICYIAVFGFIFLRAASKFRNDKNLTLFFLMSIIVFFIVSNLPSAFLLLDINWIFTALILVFYKNEFSGA
ncbi:MAG TPA: O-antigen ligase family protein [Bacteroidales bacterium]|nr:O-antigen ligase family protein [Bacteroidales bacterium]